MRIVRNVILSVCLLSTGCGQTNTASLVIGEGPESVVETAGEPSQIFYNDRKHLSEVEGEFENIDFSQNVVFAYEDFVLIFSDRKLSNQLDRSDWLGPEE